MLGGRVYYMSDMKRQVAVCSNVLSITFPALHIFIRAGQLTAVKVTAKGPDSSCADQELLRTVTSLCRSSEMVSVLCSSTNLLDYVVHPFTGLLLW